MKSHSEDNKRLARNTIALYLRTAIVMVVSLYVARVLLQVLGEEDFGVYNVVGSIVILFSFLNNSLSQATQRFLSYELGNNNKENVQKVFSMSMFSQIFVMLIILIFSETIGLWLLNSKLNIPEARVSAANWVYQLSIITFCINIIKVPYDSSVVAYEKMSFFAYASIIDAGLKLLLVLLLSHSSYDKLIYYAVLLSVESFIMLVVYVIYCKICFQTCHLIWIWDKPLFKRLLSFSGWSLCGGMTNVATQKGFLLLLNVFYGVVANAAMGIANQIVSAVTSFTGGFQTSFRPQIVKTFAQNDNDYLLLLVSRTSKFSFLLLFIPASVIVINLPLVLNVWLGADNVPQYTISFCIFILITSIIDATTGPYNSAITATGKIKMYQILISVSFILDIVASFILMRIGVSPQYVLIPRIFTRGILNMFIGLFFLKKLIHFDIQDYVVKVMLPILLYLTIMVVSLLFIFHISCGWWLLLFSTLFVITIGSILAYKIVLDSNERMVLKKLINKKIFKSLE